VLPGAIAGVLDYWVVNPQTETITVFRRAHDGYEEAGIYRRGESAVSVTRPESSVAVAEVFDAALIK
jgi:Uma2 family endonuclease